MPTKKILFSLEVTIVFLSLTVYLWHTTEATERQKRHQAIEIGANQLKGGIEAFVNEKVSVLIQVKKLSPLRSTLKAARAAFLPA